MTTKTPIVSTDRKIELLGEDHPKVHRARELADQRYGQALWYAFGAADLRPDLQDKFRQNPKREMAFAEKHKDDALAFYLDLTHYLPSVQDAFHNWIDSLD